jgi:Type IV secretory pathway, TrbL components
MALQLTNDDLLTVLGQYYGDDRRIDPAIEQWLSTQQQTTAPVLTYNGDVNPQSRDVTTYSFDNLYGNEFGAAPIGPDGQPLWIPQQQQSVGRSLGKLATSLGGAAAIGTAGMWAPSLFGGAGAGGAGGAGSAAAAAPAASGAGGLFDAASLAAIDGVAPASLGAGAAGAGAAGAAGVGASALGTGAAGAAASGLGSLFSNPNIIGAGLGALAGAAGSGDQTQTTQTLMDPSARAYLDSFRARAEQVAGQPYQAPTFNVTQGPTAQQGQGTDALRGVMSSPMTGQVNSTLGGFMDGSRNGTAAANPYAGPNAFLDPMIAAAQGDLSRSYANTVAPKFSMGSSFGNSGLGFAEVESRNDLMRNLGRIGTDMRFADYNLQAGLGEQAAQRQDNMFTGNQNRALQGAQLGQQGVRDQADMANTLFNQGSTLWNQGQQNIGNQWAQYTNQQDYARNQLSAMNPGLGVGMNAGTSQTTPGNPWAGAVGGAVLGSQFGNWMTGSGTGQRAPISLFG